MAVSGASRMAGSSSIAATRSVAPPCKGPLRAARPASRQAGSAAPVEATTRADGEGGGVQLVVGAEHQRLADQSGAGFVEAPGGREGGVQEGGGAGAGGGFADSAEQGGGVGQQGGVVAAPAGWAGELRHLPGAADERRGREVRGVVGGWELRQVVGFPEQGGDLLQRGGFGQGGGVTAAIFECALGDAGDAGGEDGLAEIDGGGGDGLACAAAGAALQQRLDAVAVVEAAPG